MNADVLKSRVVDGIVVLTLGSARRIYFEGHFAVLRGISGSHPLCLFHLENVRQDRGLL
jgi:hypothetical protein